MFVARTSCSTRLALLTASQRAAMVTVGVSATTLRGHGVMPMPPLVTRSPLKICVGDWLGGGNASQQQAKFSLRPPLSYDPAKIALSAIIESVRGLVVWSESFSSALVATPISRIL